MVDSGASSHMTNLKSSCSTTVCLLHQKSIGIGDGRVVDAVGTGNIRLNMLFKISDSKRAIQCTTFYTVKSWHVFCFW